MMKARTFSVIAALAALVLLSAGCKKNSWRLEPGTQIRFRAVSDPGRDLDSKTTYSGQFFTVDGYTNKFERIDWSEGDLITIAYLSHTNGSNFKIASDDYKVTGVSNNGDQKSYATIAPTGGPYGTEGEGWGGNGLTWQDNETHMFYACYPGVIKDSDYTFEMDTDAGKIVATVPFNYPATQVVTPSATAANVYLPDMTYAAMLYSDPGTGVSLPSGKDKVINLSFSPHFTAFEFQVAAKEGDSFALKSFTLSSESENIAGRFIWTLGDDDEWFDDPVEGTVSKTVSVDFSSFDITLTDAQPITFTVFTRGEEDWSDLTISFQIEDGEGTTVNRSLKLAYENMNYITFWHHLKHKISGLRIPLELTAETLWFEASDAGTYTDLPWVIE